MKDQRSTSTNPKALSLTKTVANWHQKHAVFIISTGRTGTQFMAEALPKMISDCVAFHEPDTLWVDRLWEYFTDVFWKQIRRHGLYHMTIGQAYYTSAHLSAANHRGAIRTVDAERWLTRLREKFIEQVPQSIYIESNGLLWGVVEQLLSQMSNAKIVLVVRNPRTWIRSAVFASHYRAFKWPDYDFLKFSPRPYHSESPDFTRKEWSRLSLPDKYAWLYGSVNGKLLQQLEAHPRALILRYEDLFEAENYLQTFQQFLDFSSVFPDGFQRPNELQPDVIARPKDSTKNMQKPQRMWTPTPSILAEHCGEIMTRFGYE